MKRLFPILLTLAIFYSVSAQTYTDRFRPSYYFTYGDYSNDRLLRSHSAYATLNFKTADYLVLGFDNLIIQDKEFEYFQKSYFAGGMLQFHPFYLKLNYARTLGDYDYLPEPWEYDETMNLFNAEALYYIRPLYFGLNFTYIKQSGEYPVSIKQAGAKLIYYPLINLYFVLNPHYTILSIGDKRFALNMKAGWYPVKKLHLSTEIMAGKRGHYFDPDKLTIFSQPETQDSFYGLRAEYDLTDYLQLIGSFQYTNFEHYFVKYYVVGIKSAIGL